MFSLRSIRRKILLALFAVASALIMLTALGCNKCRTLAELICDCQESILARDSCVKALDVQANHKAFDRAVNENKCVEVMENTLCNCEAIRNFEFEKCGMTRQVDK